MLDQAIHCLGNAQIAPLQQKQAMPIKGTSQYLWEYGTGKFATGPPVNFVPQLDGATGYFEILLYGAAAYFGV